MRPGDTEVYFNEEDVGKNLYRKKTYYTLMIEQEVLASNRVEAEDLFRDSGGICHSAVSKDLTENRDGVETSIVDAEYKDMDAVEYIGQVMYEPYEEAEGHGDVEINESADEVLKTPYIHSRRRNLTINLTLKRSTL